MFQTTINIFKIGIIVFLCSLENVYTQTTTTTRSTTTRTTKTTTPTDYSYLGYTLGLGLGLSLFFILLAGGLSVGCYFLKRKANMQRSTISPNWQSPAVQAQYAGRFPTTNYPPGYPGTGTVAPPTYPPTTPSLYPSLSNNNTIDPPPKYDSYANQSATINNNEMPVLPATISVQKY